MRRKNLYWQLPFLTILIIASVIIIKNQRSTPYQHDTGFVFGTVYHVIYQNDKSLKAEIEAELKKVDNTLSMFNKSSIISQINQDQSPKVNKMFTEVFTLAQKVSAETNGAFDITVAPLVNAWGFGFKSGINPDRHTIDSLMQTIGYKKVSLADGHVKKTVKGTMLDCSAIAKGYGSDVVARLMRQHGIENFMVEIGGEIVTKGNSEKRMPWRVGVTKPSDDSLSVSQEVQTVLNVTDIAMATSGNYRNFYYKGGRKYAHTIDPKTGYPVQHNILSATVLAQDCATADAYATSFMVMGLDKARKVLDRHPELMAYFIYADRNGNNQVWFSPALKAKISE